MKRKIYFIILILALGMNGTFVCAESIHEKAGTTSAQFLKVAVGARPVALGETYCALADDTFGILWNPAGASDIRSVEYACSYNKWLSDIGKEVVMVSMPYKSTSTISFGVMYLHVPGMTKSDVYGNDDGRFNAYSMALVLSYSKALSEKFNAGATFKYLQEGIENEKATGVCSDFGGIYKMYNDKLSLGVSVLNLGTSMKFVKESFPLPATFKGGLAYDLKKYRAKMLFDVSKCAGEFTRYSVGAEYNLYKMLFLRGGYNTKLAATMGFGIFYKLLHFDYAFVPYGDLGYTHRASMRLKFNYVPKIRKKKSHKTITYIYGAIVDIDDNPVENPTVKISQDGNERLRVMAYPVNTYKTPELPFGKYEIKAWKTGYQPEYREVEINDGTPIKLDFEFIPIKDSNYIHGIITDEDDNPIEKAVITISQKGEDLMKAETGPKGAYGTSELEFGYYTVKVEKEGYKTRRKTCRVRKGRPTVLDISLRKIELPEE
jgi:hypothetical protein